MLHALADALEENAEELARLESRDVGKPITSARGEMPSVVDCLRFFAGACRVVEGKSAGEYVRGYTSMIRREPVGVVGQIAPWNYPLMMAAWKVGPALASGNTVVLKPSEQTPLTTLRMAELAADIFPRGVLNVITGDGEPVGAGIVRHPKVGHGLPHGRRRNRQGGREGGGRDPQARPPRARRQGARDRLRRRGRRGGGRERALRRVHQLGARLHRGLPHHRGAEDIRRAHLRAGRRRLDHKDGGPRGGRERRDGTGRLGGPAGAGPRVPGSGEVRRRHRVARRRQRKRRRTRLLRRAHAHNRRRAGERDRPARGLRSRRDRPAFSRTTKRPFAGPTTCPTGSPPRCGRRTWVGP